MNWMNFFTFCGIAYAAYYFVLFLLDSRASAGRSDEKAPVVLTFSEEVVAEKVSLADFDLKSSLGGTGIPSSPASVGMGGVSIKDLFVLAQKDAIQYTRSVSF